MNTMEAVLFRSGGKIFCRHRGKSGHSMSALGHFRQIGMLPTLGACPLRSKSGQANACLDMSALCQHQTRAPQQKRDRSIT
jgi:hypothetical protein